MRIFSRASIALGTVKAVPLLSIWAVFQLMVDENFFQGNVFK
jgi:hypothetical protein